MAMETVALVTLVVSVLVYEIEALCMLPGLTTVFVPESPLSERVVAMKGDAIATVAAWVIYVMASV